MRKNILAALIISTTSMVGHTQTNPLSDLVGALGKMSNAAMESGNQAKKQQGTDVGQTDEIMSQLASQDPLSSFGCDRNHTEKNIQAEVNSFKMGQYTQASGGSLVYAQHIANCALKRANTASLDDKNMVGQLLAMSAVAASRAGLKTTETMIRGEYALALLTLNPERNQDLIAQVKSEVLPKGAPKSSATAATRMSAFDMATRYQKNKLAFVREHEGKTIQVDGVISSIGGDAKQGLIVLKGIPKHPDEQAFRDVVQCRITDSEALDNAMRVEKGQKISIRGIYMNKQLDMGPTIYDCKIAS